MKFTIALATTFNVAVGESQLPPMVPGESCGPVMPMLPLQYTCTVSFAQIEPFNLNVTS